MSVNNPLFIQNILSIPSLYVYTGVIGKSVNKQRIICDKIAESRYSIGKNVNNKGLYATE